ncbi:M17 family metallopeptidase [Mycoplasma anserisalpingitidis]|uniref:M17 family metallopeptidase n=1 Tax=Mycoplasma anserisalpingitidis TaxID=519450 RepID=UPI001CF6DC1D|nr:M17 family metallopeptidase [Mycoplasma anserisalpingitidis]UCU26793.1 leucyl aminopeptidase family protein [Mycoplasma anserisalpingitidis]UCU27632.1 leucyl aminopeptidase family protein [Mycoplasma anserisalpingitidis]
MKKLNFTDKFNSENLLVSAVFEQNAPKFVKKENGSFLIDKSTNKAYLYFEEQKYNYFELKNQISKIFAVDSNIDIDLKSFVKNDLSEQNLIRLLILDFNFNEAKLFKRNKKSEKVEEEKEFSINVVVENFSEYKELINEVTVISQAVNDCRNLQIMPENFLNSEVLAEKIADDFKNIENLKVRVLTKAQIRELNMGLLLSVNKGSTHEPRVVVVEYKNNPESREHNVYVGKGITFDTGGVNTKGYHMGGMKFDMSGSVIVAYAVKAMAQLKLKVNASAVMMITDNRLANDASLPENIYESMSGKWVEVTDTDAEGRLVLADGLYYGARELKATQLVDVATLTGSLSYALGSVYTGIWSTDDKKWELFNQAANVSYEKVWRMPLHEDFHKSNKESKVADLNNYSSSSKSDSNSAAMFLKEFTNDVPYIHCDVAFTADIKGEPQGVLIPTLVEFAKLNN